jgi:ankyrin repeat protein
MLTDPNAVFAYMNGRSQLMLAAEAGNGDVVSYLLERSSIDINQEDPQGDTALDFACRRGHLLVVELLVAAGARVETRASNNRGALFSAAQGGNVEVVKFLVEEVGVESVVNRNGETAFLRAAQAGSVAVVEYLLGRPATNIHQKNFQGLGALHLACAGAHLEIVKLLVRAGLRVNPQSSDAWGPLSSAAIGGDLQVFKYLVEEAGADELRVYRDGQTVLMCAARKGNVDIIEYLLGRPGVDIHAKTRTKGETALGFAGRNGQVEAMRLLIAAGARVEAGPSDEWWPLFSAALGGSLQAVKFLVEEAGADESRAGRDGVTPLIKAASMGHTEVVEYLLGRPGTHVYQRMAEGKRPIELACARGHLEVVRLLAVAELRLNPEARKTWGGLLLAAQEHPDVVQYLLNELYQAEVEERQEGPDAQAPPLEAAQEPHVEVSVPELMDVLLCHRNILTLKGSGVSGFSG